MGIYKDVSIYCDIDDCNVEGFETISIKETRWCAKQEGWKRKKIDGEWKDICPTCDKKDK